MQLTAVLIVDSALCGGARSHGAPRLTALEHVANRPIVHHVLDGLHEANVDQLIVAGEADALIDVRASVHDYGQHFRTIEYALCRDGIDFQSTLNAVAHLVGDSACLIHPADGLLDSPVRPPDAADTDADLVLFMPGNAGSGAHRGGTHRPATDRLQVHAAHALPDVALFGPGMLGRAYEAGGGATRDLAGTGELMAARGATVRVQPVGGWRRYRGDGQDLLELNRVALDRITPAAPRPIQGANRLEGRVHVDPTAIVRDSVIIGPTVIGAGATISQAYIGPYTSIGVGAHIEGTEIERSIVASGARVTHVGVRLVSSLVGRDAHIFRDFSLPRALRLWLGDGDEVALC